MCITCCVYNLLLAMIRRKRAFVITTLIAVVAEVYTDFHKYMEAVVHLSKYIAQRIKRSESQKWDSYILFHSNRKCGDRGRRPFLCNKCGEENADRNAAFNIGYRALGYTSTTSR